MKKKDKRNIHIYQKKRLRSRAKRKEAKKKKRREYHLRQAKYRKNNPKIKNLRYGYGGYRKKDLFHSKQPLYSERINYFRKVKNAFADEKTRNHSNQFLVPVVFSLCDNYIESCEFLRKIFNALYYQSYDDIYLDYCNCLHIGVDASICMDIILADFINYYNDCVSYGKNVKVKSITPVNYERDEVKRVLFSIGAFSTIKQLDISFENVIAFKLRIGDKKNERCSQIREIHITRTVDYIISCLSKMNRALTIQAETNLYKVIGEMIINAEEHSSTSKRYLIGYFEDKIEENHHFGSINLAILNWGDSIYETFKSPNCKNYEVLKQMEDLSNKYTKRNFFRKAEFEEETLWTLYALQEGVTRKEDWKRGNGSIRFIESFFKLKGNDSCDNISKMTITSGNTQIVFNGAYGIIEKTKKESGEKYKMMTFNNTGSIEDKPDDKYVSYTNNYFPGTLISAKIYIDENNTEVVTI